MSPPEELTGVIQSVRLESLRYAIGYFQVGQALYDGYETLRAVREGFSLTSYFTITAQSLHGWNPERLNRAYRVYRHYVQRAGILPEEVADIAPFLLDPMAKCSKNCPPGITRKLVGRLRVEELGGSFKARKTVFQWIEVERQRWQRVESALEKEEAWIFSLCKVDSWDKLIATLEPI